MEWTDNINTGKDQQERDNDTGLGGRYVDANFALEKTGDLSNEEIQSDLNSDDEAEAEVESLEGCDSKLEEVEEMKMDQGDPNPDHGNKERM